MHLQTSERCCASSIRFLSLRIISYAEWAQEYSTLYMTHSLESNKASMVSFQISKLGPRIMCAGFRVVSWCQSLSQRRSWELYVYSSMLEMNVLGWHASSRADWRTGGGRGISDGISSLYIRSNCPDSIERCSLKKNKKQPAASDNKAGWI